MPTDLNILKKAFQNATATYEAAKPWDEPLDRRESVTTDQTFAAPVIPGDVGGWMASGGYPYQSTEKSSLAEYAQEGAVPPSQTYHETNPGREGYNDVDFVPYNWNTNRFGSKGGALLGHPISWEVVGPTSKSPFLHWQWAVNGTNNTLTLEAGLLTAAGGYGVPTVEEAYNLSATGISDYNGGLYVLVTLTGDEVGGMLTVGSNGLIPTNLLTSRFELFRVNSYSGQVITLESSKLLSSYFTLPGSPKVRSITLLRPKVTRLAGFPLSLNGTTQRNQVFAFLPPESAAVSEYMPPYDGGTLCPDWSVTGNFDDAGAIPAGATADYGTPNLLPIPAPVFQTYGYVTTALASAARWNLFLILTGANTITAGQLVRVQNTMRATLTDDGVAQTFGWFEAVTGLNATGVVTLRRVPEVNSSTGAVFYGNGPVSAGTQDIVIVEVYDNIGTIFTDPVLSISKVVAARLDHLIDPSAESTSFRNYGSTNPARLGTPPGPAIFDTVTGSRNPGNLSDLGFRVVLFPAKSFGGVIAPDFDNPITGNRVVLDPTLPATTEQYLEVDYSAGVLYLSHPPVPGAGCAVAPTGIIPDAVNNPRNEVVLYAACVPYSREPSQRGGGVRVTVSRLGDGFGSHDSADIYGQRVVLELNEPVGTNIANGGSFNIAGDATKFPARTGWFRFGEVAPVTGAFTSLSDPYYYPNGVVITPTNYIVQIVAMGGVTYTTTANTRVVFLKSPVNNNNNPWDSDAVRGSSKRFDRINFRGGRTEVSVDGSLTLTAGSTTLDEAYRAGDPSTPGAGRVITVDGGAVEAQPDNTAGGDTFNASFRVDTTAVATNSAALVGFDFKGSGSIDPYAGFIDRRVFAPTTGDTVLADPFTCDVAVNVVTVTTGGNKFWTSLGVPRSLLMIPFDLIEIEGVTYLILSLDNTLPAGSSVVIVNLDGTAVNLTLSGVTAKVYRTRFYTSRGNTGSYPLNFNSWFAAQSRSETLNGEPIGALNLFAGSNTAISPGDGGGSTAALSFWSKFVAGGNTLEVRSPTYFDTFGRLNSSLTRGYFNTTNLADYRYRGDYVTRAVKDLNVFTGYPVIGHIVEDYTYDQYRYDYLSLLPLLSTVLPYTATTTVNTNTNGELVLVTALNFELIPYGSAILEVLSVDSDTTMRGLYLVYSGISFPSTTLYIRGLDNNAPFIPSVTGAGGQSVVFRLYAYSAQGRNVNAPYWDSYGVLARTHTPTHTIAVGSEANAVGLAINSPDMKTGTGDRYAYRVSYGGAGTATQPSNNEIAALDSYGYHKAQDYLYLESRTITKQINPHLFNPVDSTNNPAWVWINNNYWRGNGDNHEINIPLDLPRSSDRTDSAGTTRTHRTWLKSITVNGRFHGNVGNPATVRVYMIKSSVASPASVVSALLLSGVTYFNLPSAGADTSSTITITTNPGVLPVYIDDTTDYYYYAIVTSNNINGNTDRLYSVSVTYTDPGPKNY